MKRDSPETLHYQKPVRERRTPAVVFAALLVLVCGWAGAEQGDASCRRFKESCGVTICGLICGQDRQELPCDSEVFASQRFDEVRSCDLAQPWWTPSQSSSRASLGLGLNLDWRNPERLQVQSFSNSGGSSVVDPPGLSLRSATIRLPLALRHRSLTESLTLFPTLHLDFGRQNVAFEAATGDTDRPELASPVLTLEGDGRSLGAGVDLVMASERGFAGLAYAYRTLSHFEFDSFVGGALESAGLDMTEHRLGLRFGRTFLDDRLAPYLGVRVGHLAVEAQAAFNVRSGDLVDRVRQEIDLERDRTSVTAGLDVRFGSSLFGRFEIDYGASEASASAGLAYRFGRPKRALTEIQSTCQVDEDCDLGFVCETQLVGDCDSEQRRCVPGCRDSERGCPAGWSCRKVVCKTCPCPDLCEGSSGPSCGLPGMAPCGDGEFCEFPLDTGCGASGVAGLCAPRPDPGECPAVFEPVCGCDGQTYRNACSAETSGVGVASVGVCQAEPEDCAPSTGTFSNGGFESDSLDSWDLCYRTGTGRWRTKRPDDFPEPETISSSTPLLPLQGEDIDPYCGDHTARINDLEGGEHSTLISQKVKLEKPSPCAYLNLQWGAMLQDPSHAPDDQPFFSIKVKRNRKEIYHVKKSASAAASDGWQDIGRPDESDPVWYKSETFTQDLFSYNDGDTIDVEMVAADCAQGAHGGAAFIDCFDILDPCDGDCPLPIKEAMPKPKIPNVFTPNGDGKNDTWDLQGVHGACRIVVELYNRWGRRTAWNVVGTSAGYDDETVTLWDGRKRRKGGKYGKPAPSSQSPFYYILEMTNCSGSQVHTGFVYLFRCKEDFVESGAFTKRRKARAKGKARRDWKKEVRSQFGKEWRSWSRASDRGYDCSRSNRRWTCTAKGRPCMR